MRLQEAKQILKKAGYLVRSLNEDTEDGPRMSLKDKIANAEDFNDNLNDTDVITRADGKNLLKTILAWAKGKTYLNAGWERKADGPCIFIESDIGSEWKEIEFNEDEQCFVISGPRGTMGYYSFEKCFELIKEMFE